MVKSDIQDNKEMQDIVQIKQKELMTVLIWEVHKFHSSMNRQLIVLIEEIS